MARITGTPLNDSLVGTILDDTIRGLAGNDYLVGGAGNDTIEGGDGDDTLEGGDGNDTLNGGNGNDSLYTGAGNNSVYGGDGDDFVSIDSPDAASSNLVDGGAGTDRLLLSLWGSTQPITITFANGTFSLPGITATNFETLSFMGGSGNAAVYGGNGDDFLNGGSGNDILSGAGGNDNLSGGEGDDTLLGGAGDDTLYDFYNGSNVLDGGSGNDSLSTTISDFSNTIISGGTGIDTLSLSCDTASQGITLSLINNSIMLPNVLTATGVERLGFSGSSYADTVTGGNSNDDLSGNSGNDTLSGGNGNDNLWGSSDNDTLSGGNGYDKIVGGDGDDVIDGGNGIDQLYGDDEYSFGLGGNDVLIGDLGADQMTGGGGADQFKFAAASGPGRFVAGRAILDFSQTEADKIVLAKTMFPALQSAIGDGFSIPTEFATVQSATAAAASSALIVYNIRTGILFYNANGIDAGFGDGGQFVTLTTKPALTTADFMIQ